MIHSPRIPFPGSPAQQAAAPRGVRLPRASFVGDPSLGAARGGPRGELPSGLVQGLAQMAWELSGIPQRASGLDPASARESLLGGHWFRSVVSGRSGMPWIGELSLRGPWTRYERTLELLDLVLRGARDAATSLRPGLESLARLCEFYPRVEPADRSRRRLREIVRRLGGEVRPSGLPDISSRFRFPPPYTEVRFRRRFEIREARGRLGAPGLVRKHRKTAAQTRLSGGTGDHAGHLIANKFGAPGGGENLTLQNAQMNPGGGTFYDYERRWEEMLLAGCGIDLTVAACFPITAGVVSPRPQLYDAEWTVVSPDGARSTGSGTFINGRSAARPA